MKRIDYTAIHETLGKKLERIEALSFVLGKANDEADVDTSDYTATVADVIHDLAEEARVLFSKMEDKALLEDDDKAA